MTGRVGIACCIGRRGTRLYTRDGGGRGRGGRSGVGVRVGVCVIIAAAWAGGRPGALPRVSAVDTGRPPSGDGAHRHRGTSGGRQGRHRRRGRGVGSGGLCGRRRNGGGLGIRGAGRN